MIQALIFDCFGVLIVDTPEAVRAGQSKNQALLQYITELRRTYKIGLLSNISRQGLESRFSENELAAHFDAIVISDEATYAKPQAEAFHITAERLGVQPQACIMIDDTEGHCNGARAAGMQAIHYTSFHQLQTELQAMLLLP